ncbi:hypothetical protein B0H17DRAFT_1140095 [Mycena rosella]|uniref:Uncharacterized protein n=1 Tax=Mycena rosella TaxID=1033263 RepID=A0AAD7D370_MYCRO|nr:hypothetical protein B0H17DRAFT_1140095 [Mycena rosella]
MYWRRRRGSGVSVGARSKTSWHSPSQGGQDQSMPAQGREYRVIEAKTAPDFLKDTCGGITSACRIWDHNVGAGNKRRLSRHGDHVWLAKINGMTKVHGNPGLMAVGIQQIFHWNQSEVQIIGFQCVHQREAGVERKNLKAYTEEEK